MPHRELGGDQRERLSFRHQPSRVHGSGRNRVHGLLRALRPDSSWIRNTALGSGGRKLRRSSRPSPTPPQQLGAPPRECL